MTVIAARPSLPVAVAILQRAGLPTADLTEERLEEFFEARDSSGPLGIVGLELSPPDGLLRSLVVETHARRRGLGSRLLAHAEAHARSRGVRWLYLLTTTAEAFFAGRGYVRAERSEAPPSIRSSAEFTALCPASAAFMVKHLEE